MSFIPYLFIQVQTIKFKFISFSVLILYAGFNVEGFLLISDTSKRSKLTITHHVCKQITKHQR